MINQPTRRIKRQDKHPKSGFSFGKKWKMVRKLAIIT